MKIFNLRKKEQFDLANDAWTKGVKKKAGKNCIIMALLACVLLSGTCICVYAAKVSITPVEYKSVGTDYVTKTSFIPDKSGGKLYVRTRPTTTTDAKLRIRHGNTTLAEGTFPYQTQGPYISTSMSAKEQYNVQVSAVSGKVSGQISGYASYGN